MLGVQFYGKCFPSFENQYELTLDVQKQKNGFNDSWIVQLYYKNNTKCSIRRFLCIMARIKSTRKFFCFQLPLAQSMIRYV